MTRLCDLAVKYGCDKTKSIFHDYTPFYDQLLQRPVKRVLEIGIGTVQCMNHMEDYKPGASLRMWREYFNEQASVWGLDVDPSVMFQEVGINTTYCDQSSIESLLHTARLLGGKFDVIIDDGSHVLEHQALTANLLIPALLSPTGVYVIEDVVWRRELYPLLPWPVEVKIFDLKRTPDDCLFIVEGSKL